jgi:hypothetical protein
MITYWTGLKGLLDMRANNLKETNQKPAGGFLIAHFKRYLKREEA